ncbi:MAG: uvrD/REp helicase family protein, partial [Hyperionvirus sp.]
MLLYDLALNKKVTKSKYNIFNLKDGLQYELSLEFNNAYYFDFLSTIAQAASLKLNNVKLVYDLETTGLIDNGSIPDILQICVLDYDTRNVFYNDYVDVGYSIPTFITELTGIKNRDIKGKPTIAQTISMIRERFQDIMSVKLIAHNG